MGVCVCVNCLNNSEVRLKVQVVGESVCDEVSVTGICFAHGYRMFCCTLLSEVGNHSKRWSIDEMAKYIHESFNQWTVSCRPV